MTFVPSSKNARLHSRADQLPAPWQPAFAALARGHDAVIVLDASGRVHRLSRPLGGLMPADILGHPLAGCVVPSHARPMQAAVRHCQHPGIAQTIEAPVPTGAGHKWYRFHMVPWRHEDVVLVQCTDIDATHAELERLRGADQIVRDTQGISHMGVWTWDITKPHAEWSDGLYAIYGLDQETHVPTYEDYLSRVHPEDVERVRVATEAVFNDQAPYSHDERIRHADGSWRHLHTWARPITDADGNLQALQGVCMDITERKEAELALARSETRQKAILEHAGLGIATLTAEGRIEDANRAFLELLGGGEVPCTIDELLPAEAAAQVHSMVDGVFAGGPDAGGQRIVAAGPGRWVRIILNFAKELHEGFVVAVAQDVSAEHLAREAERRIHELEEAGRERARRLGMASHEIKNPLTPMLLQMELLRRTTSDLGQKERGLIDRLGVQVNRLDRLVRDFLDTARAEEGDLPIHAEALDLAQVLRGVVEAHQPAAERLGIALEIAAPQRAPAQADAGRIAQVIDNLVANALRFTPGGGSVTVRIKERPSDFRITVVDTGVGISDEGQDRLFMPYAEPGVEPVNPGPTAGLGLYICKAIVEAHGGTIGIDSKVGKGTSVWLTIPRNDPLADERQ